MEELAATHLFVTLIRSGGFTQAARESGLSTATVSRRLQALEAELGTRLIDRSNRGIQPTSSGLTYLRYAERMLSALSEAREEISEDKATAKGVMKVRAQMTFGTRVVLPLAHAFMNLHPQLRVSLLLYDQPTNLVEDSVDVMIRAGRLPDSSWRCRRVAPMPDFVLCASPTYLNERGVPQLPTDLECHDKVAFIYNKTSVPWVLRGPAGEHVQPVTGRFSSNNLEAVRGAALDHLGICIVPYWCVADELRSGRLVRVLTDYRSNFANNYDEGIYVVWPEARYTPSRIRLFIDYAVDHLPSYLPI